MTLRKPNWIAAAGIAALSMTSAFAQDSATTGIVRITDGRARTSVQKTSFHDGQGTVVESGMGYSDCPTCQPNCQCQKCQCLSNLFRERYCKNSPDHGYSPPAKYPLHRRGVQYNSYFPQQWYGTPGASYAAAPIVYQPTDTTQLGFYYQHVPMWMPQYGNLPQRPVPAQWHITAPTVSASRFHGWGGAGYGIGAYGYGQDCPDCQLSPTQSTTPSSPTEVQPTPAPVPPTEGEPKASLPPAPRQFETSAESGHIRRAAY